MLPMLFVNALNLSILNARARVVEGEVEGSVVREFDVFASASASADCACSATMYSKGKDVVKYLVAL